MPIMPLSRKRSMVGGSMSGTRAMGVKPAISAKRQRSSRMSIVKGPCSLSNETKSKPALPASSISVGEANEKPQPYAVWPAFILVITLLVRIGSIVRVSPWCQGCQAISAGIIGWNA